MLGNEQDAGVNSIFTLISSPVYGFLNPFWLDVIQSLVASVFGQLFCLHTHMTAAPTAPVIKATQVLTFSSHQCRCSTPAAAAFSRRCLAVLLDLVHCNTAKWVKGWTGSPNLMLTPCPWILYLVIGPSRGLVGRK